MLQFGIGSGSGSGSCRGVPETSRGCKVVRLGVSRKGERFHRCCETMVVCVDVRVRGKVGLAEDRPGDRRRRTGFFDIGECASASASGQIARDRIDVRGVGSVVVGGIRRVEVREAGIGDMDIGGVSRRRGVKRSGCCRILAEDIGAEEVREAVAVCLLA